MHEPDRTGPDKAALLSELQHRVRNTLATMRAVVRRSAETSESLDAYVMHLEGRLDALARVQNAFVRNPGNGIDLGLLVADELAAVRVQEGKRLRIEGPPLQLHARAAEPFSLALHELTTNALKFGALSGTSGRIAVTWQVEHREDADHLVFDWIETGRSPPVEPPTRRGFGRSMLEDALPHNLGATTTIVFRPEGLTCRILVPLDGRILKRGPASANDA